MRAELYQKLSEPQVLEIRRVLFRDNFGNPFCVVIEQAPGKYWVKTIADTDFHDALRIMGVRDTVIVQKLKDDKERGIILP
jgi:hypothetical protein